MKLTPGASDDAEFDAIESSAARWLARCDRGLTAEETLEYALWRSADPRHEAAVAELNAMWNALDDLATVRKGVPVASASPSAPVDDHDAEKIVPMPGRRRFLSSWALPLAACVAVGAGIFAWQRSARVVPSVAHYETAIGAQQTFMLPDGSTLQLNTNSAIDVHYTAGERRLELQRGEAFFSVTKDASRPFIVSAGGIESRALGTKFVVRQREHDTELVVTEGRVKFGAAGAQGTSVEVTAGQFAVGESKNPGALRVDALDEAAMARRLAWQSGRLVCRKDMPLAEAAEEFNRYHRTQLMMLDAEAGAVQIGGAFELANFDAFVTTLETSFDIVVAERDPQHVVLKLKR